MQISCFCLDWNEVRQRSSAQAIVDEMICTDDVDLYSEDIPDDIWLTDSARLHFEVGRALSEMLHVVPAADQPSLEAIARLISDGESIDELGITELTEGCYFISMSPERVAAIHHAFQMLDLQSLAELHARNRIAGETASYPEAETHFVAYLQQWRDAIHYANERGYGLIGHCG